MIYFIITFLHYFYIAIGQLQWEVAAYCASFYAA